MICGVSPECGLNFLYDYDTICQIQFLVYFKLLFEGQTLKVSGGFWLALDIAKPFPGQSWRGVKGEEG